MAKVRCKLVSWNEVVKWCMGLADKILESGWKPDVIVAIARGAYVPARLLCDLLQVTDLVSVQVAHWGRAAEITTEAHIKCPVKADLSGRKVLIVDDIADTGESIIIAKKHIEQDCNPAEVKVATMQWISSVCKIKPDYYVEEVKEWIWYQYPWTRLEDTIDFIEKMLKEEGKEKKEWTRREIISKFKEWYGIDVGKQYYDRAIAYLIKQGTLEEQVKGCRRILIYKG